MKAGRKRKRYEVFDMVEDKNEPIEEEVKEAAKSQVEDSVYRDVTGELKRSKRNKTPVNNMM